MLPNLQQLVEGRKMAELGGREGVGGGGGEGGEIPFNLSREVQKEVYLRKVEVRMSTTIVYYLFGY
jgi:hypothetical protein